MTKRVVDGLTPESKPVFIWDSRQIGFGVKVLPTGGKKYVVKYRTRGGGRSAQQRWYLLGTHGAITLDKARELAEQVLHAVADGKDPQGQKLTFRESPTVKDLWDRFEKDHLPNRKESSSRHYKLLWRVHLEPEIGRKKVLDISRTDVDRIHRGMRTTPYQANRALALVSKMFNLAERWGLRPDGTSPCRHIEKYPEQSRTRYLSQDELIKLGDALREGLGAQTETPHMVAAIQLLLLTGARLNEIMTAEWDWVDWERQMIQLPDSKTGAKPIYLSGAAIGILRSLEKLPARKKNDNPYIIAGRFKKEPLTNLTKAWHRIRERAGLDSCESMT